MASMRQRGDMAPAQFDYIIVGGGSAGSALAARTN
jgi:choline dehydrogenase-like flavoprotein